MPTAVYATDRDFADGVLVSAAIRERAGRAVNDIGFVLAARSGSAIAAE